MTHINSIYFINFKRFARFEAKFDPAINLLIGDNEAGKSSILTAIDLVLSGSKNKVEAIGLENIFNAEAINTFLASGREYKKMPQLVIEVYLNETNNENLFGRNNLSGVDANGLSMTCIPNDDLGSNIVDILKQKEPHFPFEFYSINFTTFAGQAYSGYNRYVKHLVIDTAQTSNEYAMKEYAKDIYFSSISGNVERYNHQHSYRVHKDDFKNKVLLSLNEKLEGYHFAIRTSSKSNLETDLTIFEGNINIENKGKGRQVFVKTELALRNKDNELEIVLMEEPENHLSHGNTNKLITTILQAKQRQLFITTHSNMISTRLNLRKAILLNSAGDAPLFLSGLSEETARFFMKAPDHNILEFILSKKVILVEGDAEYILMEQFYFKTAGVKPAVEGVHILSVDGTSFKRYLEISLIQKIKTLVIRDNDGNYERNCVEAYEKFRQENIMVATETDNTRSTFEICIYNDNKEICEERWGVGRRTLTTLEYMLQNKADVALTLLDKHKDQLVAPEYIKQGIEWIRK